MLHVVGFQPIPSRGLPCGCDRSLILFTRIIGHNSVILYRIRTKLGIEIPLMSPLNVPIFFIGVCICMLWQILESVGKEDDEGKLWQLISWKWLGRLLQILYVDYPTTQALLYQIWIQSDKTSQSYVCVKIAFSFLLSIYSQCGAPASWTARHTTVCLDVLS